VTRSLGQLFVLAPVLRIGSVLAALMVSSWVDAPSGPAIIVLAGSCFSAPGDAPPGGLESLEGSQSVTGEPLSAFCMPPSSHENGVMPAAVGDRRKGPRFCIGFAALPVVAFSALYRRRMPDAGVITAQPQGGTPNLM
jgi:hypothetical protein